tara:strand:+ start:340 stop:447 length:108 start_codon:yes stop_codon:yes gene_type:complete
MVNEKYRNLPLDEAVVLIDKGYILEEIEEENEENE